VVPAAHPPLFGSDVVTGLGQGSAPLLVEFNRSGFLFARHLKVLRNGWADVRSFTRGGWRTGSFMLSRPRLGQLTSALQQARFLSLRSRYAPAGACPDCPTYSIPYGGRKITLGPGLERGVVPGRLAKVFSLLNRLLDVRLATRGGTGGP